MFSLCLLSITCSSDNKLIANHLCFNNFYCKKIGRLVQKIMLQWLASLTEKFLSNSFLVFIDFRVSRRYLVIYLFRCYLHAKVENVSRCFVIQLKMPSNSLLAIIHFTVSLGKVIGSSSF